VDLHPGPKVPTRGTSTISYISPREIDNPQAKRLVLFCAIFSRQCCVYRCTVSLILPVPIASNEQTTAALETILSIDDTKQSSSAELIEQERKDRPVIDKYKQNFL
jgi:hypothetical protein